MRFLPSIKDMLKEAFIDPAFKELVDSFSTQKGHINLTGMTETQKAFLIAAAALYRSENDPRYGSENASEKADGMERKQERMKQVIFPYR